MRQFSVTSGSRSPAVHVLASPLTGSSVPFPSGGRARMVAYQALSRSRRKVYNTTTTTTTTNNNNNNNNNNNSSSSSGGGGGSSIRLNVHILRKGFELVFDLHPACFLCQSINSTKHESLEMFCLVWNFDACCYVYISAPLPSIVSLLNHPIFQTHCIILLRVGLPCDPTLCVVGLKCNFISPLPPTFIAIGL